jgi:hypothetical protein
MTAKEIRSEIQKVLDKVPEALLGDILEYLKAIRGKSANTVHLSKDLSRIIAEDKELLEKLAQ